MDEETLQNVANMEGWVTGQRYVLAMLVYAARTGRPFDLVHREVNNVYQILMDSMPTSYPHQRAFFLMGMRDGFDSTIGMADAISEIMDARGHSNDPNSAGYQDDAAEEAQGRQIKTYNQGETRTSLPLFVVVHDKINGACCVTVDMEEAVEVAFNHRGSVLLWSLIFRHRGLRNERFTKMQTATKSDAGSITVSSSRQLVLVANRFVRQPYGTAENPRRGV